MGDLLGIPPSWRLLLWNAVDVYRISRGKIVEEWAADDMAAILHQLGTYTPTMAALKPPKADHFGRQQQPQLPQSYGLYSNTVQLSKQEK